MRVQRLEILGLALSGPRTWYWISGGLLVLGTWMAANLIASPTGRAVRALHDSEIAARVAGVEVARAKLVVFVVSAVYAGIAGACFASLNRVITPDTADFLHSIELIAMVVLGGMGSILGSVFGAAVLIAVPQLLTGFQEFEYLLLGLVIMLVIVLLPGGIVPGVTQFFARQQR